MIRPENEPADSVVVDVVSLLGGDPVLASRRKGERCREAIEQAAGVRLLVFLDFREAETVTPSFFNAGPWSLWERPRLEQHPMVANLPEISVDDLEWVTRERRTPIWTGRLANSGFERPLLIGEIDEGDGEAIGRIFEAGMTSAAELAAASPRLSASGWNNRLAGLWQKRVLKREKIDGRYRYSLPWKGQRNG